MPGQRRQEDQRILEPLMWSQSLDDRPYYGGHRAQRLRLHAAAPKPAREAAGGSDHIGPPRGGPDGEIGMAVADVIEPALAIALDQCRRLCMAGEIAIAIGRQHVVEHAEVHGHRLSMCLVRRRGQDHRPALGACAADQRHHLVPERQMLGVERRLGGDPRLEIGLAAKQPADQHYDHPRSLLEDAQYCLVQQIGPQQGAVAIDAQRNEPARHLRHSAPRGGRRSRSARCRRPSLPTCSRHR